MILSITIVIFSRLYKNYSNLIDIINNRNYSNLLNQGHTFYDTIHFFSMHFYNPHSIF